MRLSFGGKQYFKKWVWISLVLVYLVIIAGAVVRMTGSGMGCPDWPKCFGYLIPPTSVETLNWNPDRTYKKGQVIIVNQSLLVANRNFTTTKQFQLNHWNPYTKHDYALFNPWHTWIEFINRLVGALAGFAVLIMAVFSFFWRKEKPSYLFWSVLTVLMMGIQGYLGATVVYSVLEPIKITLHMIFALAIVAVLTYLLFTANHPELKKATTLLPKPVFSISILAILLSIIQIILGTQVRQFVDHQIDTVGELAKSEWLSNPMLSFYIHRSFSLLVLASVLVLMYYNRAYILRLTQVPFIAFIVGVEIITGILMYYVDFPFLTQPLHLIFASLLFGLQWYVVLKLWQHQKATATVSESKIMKSDK